MSDESQLKVSWIIIFLPLCNNMKAILYFSALTGLNKAETAEKHGEEQVNLY